MSKPPSRTLFKCFLQKESQRNEHITAGITMLHLIWNIFIVVAPCRLLQKEFVYHSNKRLGVMPAHVSPPCERWRLEAKENAKKNIPNIDNKQFVFVCSTEFINIDYRTNSCSA
jgi:hypothetical protein